MQTSSQSVSVIIPVYRETTILRDKLLKLLHVPIDLDIIVVDGHPSRDTLLTITDLPVTKTASGKGRGLQMNAGAELASGDILLFLHADTDLPQNAFTHIRSALTRADAGAFSLGIRSEKWIYRIIEFGVHLRNRFFTLPYGDQAVFMKRSVFDDMGGYSEIPLMEDVDMMRRLKKKGKTVKILPNKVYTDPRRWENEGIPYCTLRNWTLITLYTLGVSPRKLAVYYR